MKGSERTVAILVFDGMEPLDFAAPFEVLSLGGTRMAPHGLEVTTVGWHEEATAYNGLRITPTIVGRPARVPDVLVLPGGPGVESTIDREPDLITWIAEVASSAAWIMSICSGALFLARAGLLKGRRANTHRSDYETLRQMEPSVEIVPGKRFVSDGKFVTSAGISAGIDSSLFLLRKLLGAEVARRTADWMEYRAEEWIED